MIMRAYVTRLPLGRFAFFLLAIPIRFIDLILENGMRAEDFGRTRVIAGIILLSIVMTGLNINLRRNRLLDLSWSPFWEIISMWSPAAALLFMLVAGGPENYHLISWPIAVLAGMTLATSVLTGFALMLTPGAKARTRKNAAIPRNPMDRRSFIRPA